MNILFISKYDINQGGVAGVLNQLRDDLLTQQHRVFMLTHDPATSSTDLQRQLNKTEPTCRSAIFKIDFGVSKLFSRLRAIHQLKKMMDLFRIDVIHSHGLSRSDLGYHLSRATGVPLIVTSHGDLNHPDTYKIKRRRKIKKILSHAHYVTHLTVPMADKAHAILNTMHKSRIIHNGIDLIPWPNETDAKKNYLIAVGRFVDQKGFDKLIKAYAKAANAGLPYGLVLLGDGPNKTNLIALAQKHHVRIEYTQPKDKAFPNTLYLPGYLTGDDKRDALRAASCLLFPSQTDEAFSLVLLEAMAAGVAVIASNFAMTQYLVQCGLEAKLLPHDDIHAWQQCLLHTSEAELIEAGHRNRRIAEQFKLDAIHAQYTTLYELAHKRQAA